MATNIYDMNGVIATIVVPIYNTKDTLDRTVESIINQTYKYLDVLLIDDGSENDTKNKCDEWTTKDSRIRCIHKNNEGLGLTRNRGIREAIGKYVFFIDSDDYIEHNMISEMVSKAEEFKADVVCSSFFMDESEEDCILPGGLYENNIKKYLLPRLLGRKKTGEDDFLNVSACTKLYSIEFLKKHNISFKSERQYIWEDMAFNFDCLLYAEHVYIIDRCFYHYCYNDQSITHVYDSHKIDKIVGIYNYFLDAINNNCVSEESHIRLNYSVMGNIRMCIKQIALYCNKQEAIKEINRICNIQEVEKIAGELRGENLSKIQLLLNSAVKRKNIRIVYLLALIQNYKTKGEIS